MTSKPGVGGAGMSSTAQPGTWALWQAIWAIVATHAKHNRRAMLTAIEQVRDRHEMPREMAGEPPPESRITPVESGEGNGRLTDKGGPASAGNTDEA